MIQEINLETNKLEVIDSNVEDDETCMQDRQQLPEERRTQLLNNWYDSCISNDTDEDVYKTELKLEDKESIELDETDYESDQDVD